MWNETCADVKTRVSGAQCATEPVDGYQLLGGRSRRDGFRRVQGGRGGRERAGTSLSTHSQAPYDTLFWVRVTVRGNPNPNPNLALILTLTKARHSTRCPPPSTRRARARTPAASKSGRSRRRSSCDGDAGQQRLPARGIPRELRERRVCSDDDDGGGLTLWSAGDGAASASPAG